MPVQFSGYGYQTVLQHLDGGSRRVGALMCQMSPDYQEFADKEFQKLLDLGSSGMLYDELIVNAVSCFDPTHQHEMGECMGKGAVQMAERMYKQAVAHNPEFLMAGEGPFDLQTPYYPINYIRSWNNRWGEWQVRPAWKYLDDTQQIATCITGFDDREMIHQCMAFGYIMNYEPYNFKGKISDFPLTASYGYQATQLRRKLADYLWTGRFMDKLGVSVEVISGGDIVYSNFENRNNGKRAIVIANDHLETPLHCKVKLHGRAVAYDMYTIDRQTPSSVTDMIELPPRSFAVLVEK